MREGVLDVEVVLVIEYGDRLGRGGSGISSSGGVVATLGRDGNGRQVDLLGHFEGCLGLVACGCGYGCGWC